MHLGSVGIHRRNTGVQLQIQMDPPRNGRTEQRHNIRDFARQVQRLDDELAFAGVRQHLPDEHGSPFARLQDFRHAVARGVLVGKAAHGEARIAHDASEEVVEVVCEPAGEDAEALQLLGLPQVILEKSPLSDVASDLREAYHAAGGVADGRNRERNMDLPSVLVEPHGFQLFDGAAAADPLHNIDLFILAIRRQENRHRPAERLGSRVAEDFFGSVIPTQNGAVQGLGDYGIGRRLHHCAQLGGGAFLASPVRGLLAQQPQPVFGNARILLRLGVPAALDLDKPDHQCRADEIWNALEPIGNAGQDARSCPSENRRQDARTDPKEPRGNQDGQVSRCVGQARADERVDGKPHPQRDRSTAESAQIAYGARLGAGLGHREPLVIIPVPWC